MYFQNDDILSNLFSFGDLKIFLNRKMYTSHVEFIQKIDSTYVPRTKFPLNRTILDSKSNMYVQLDININICEIIIPSNHIEFKKNMFNHVINFMIESIKSFCDFRLANEVGYKILLYIPTKSPASQIKWWLDTVSNKISFKQENGVVGKTVLGTNLSEQYVRYTLHIFFNEQYVLVKNSQSYNGNNWPLLVLSPRQFDEYVSNPQYNVQSRPEIVTMYGDANSGGYLEFFPVPDDNYPIWIRAETYPRAFDISAFPTQKSDLEDMDDVQMN